MFKKCKSVDPVEKKEEEKKSPIFSRLEHIVRAFFRWFRPRRSFRSVYYGSTRRPCYSKAYSYGFPRVHQEDNDRGMKFRAAIEIRLRYTKGHVVNDFHSGARLARNLSTEKQRVLSLIMTLLSLLFLVCNIHSLFNIF